MLRCSLLRVVVAFFSIAVFFSITVTLFNTTATFFNTTVTWSRSCSVKLLQQQHGEASQLKAAADRIEQQLLSQNRLLSQVRCCVAKCNNLSLGQGV